MFRHDIECDNAGRVEHVTEYEIKLAMCSSSSGNGVRLIDCRVGQPSTPMDKSSEPLSA